MKHGPNIKQFARHMQAHRHTCNMSFSYIMGEEFSADGESMCKLVQMNDRRQINKKYLNNENMAVELKDKLCPIRFFFVVVRHLSDDCVSCAFMFLD